MRVSMLLVVCGACWCSTSASNTVDSQRIVFPRDDPPRPQEGPPGSHQHGLHGPAAYQQFHASQQTRLWTEERGQGSHQTSYQQQNVGKYQKPNGIHGKGNVPGEQQGLGIINTPQQGHNTHQNGPETYQRPPLQGPGTFQSGTKIPGAYHNMQQTPHQNGQNSPETYQRPLGAYQSDVQGTEMYQNSQQRPSVYQNEQRIPNGYHNSQQSAYQNGQHSPVAHQNGQNSIGAYQNSQQGPYQNGQNRPETYQRPLGTYQTSVQGTGTQQHSQPGRGPYQSVQHTPMTQQNLQPEAYQNGQNTYQRPLGTHQSDIQGHGMQHNVQQGPEAYQRPLGTQQSDIQGHRTQENWQQRPGSDRRRQDVQPQPVQSAAPEEELIPATYPVRKDTPTEPPNTEANKGGASPNGPTTKEVSDLLKTIAVVGIPVVPGYVTTLEGVLITVQRGNPTKLSVT